MWMHGQKPTALSLIFRKEPLYARGDFRCRVAAILVQTIRRLGRGAPGARGGHVPGPGRCPEDVTRRWQTRRLASCRATRGRLLKLRRSHHSENPVRLAAATVSHARSTAAEWD